MIGPAAKRITVTVTMSDGTRHTMRSNNARDLDVNMSHDAPAEPVTSGGRVVGYRPERRHTLKVEATWIETHKPAKGRP